MNVNTFTKKSLTGHQASDFDDPTDEDCSDGTDENAELLILITNLQKKAE